MLCGNPFIGAAGVPFGCGQCTPCRVNRARVWSHRIVLEASQYSDNCFVTLTYDDDHVPVDGGLVPAELRDFLKRLRRRYEPERFRFFAVGEYGDETERPHYHLALFNFKGCAFGQSQYGLRRRSCCVSCDLVRDSWGKGLVELGELEAATARYIAGYVVKKMTRVDDARLKGRHPEFARMSLRPGIGAIAMWEVASEVMRYDLDAPVALRHGRKVLPLGRYLANRVRELSGDEDKQRIAEAMAEKMRDLRLVARADSEDPSLKSHWLRSKVGEFRKFEARQRIWKQRKKL